MWCEVTIPDYDRNVNTYPGGPEVSKTYETVAEQLAAVRCEAAPWGWGPKTRGGREITHFHQCSGGYSVGEVDCGYKLRWATRWGTRGHEMDATETSGSIMSLVPLPAPPAPPAPATEPERLTDEATIDDSRLRAIVGLSTGQPDNLWSDDERCNRFYLAVYRERLQLARELIEALRTIAEQSAGIDGFQKLIELQHKRLEPLRELWQANGGQVIWPDLGALAEWATKTIAEQDETIDRLTRERDEWRNTAKDGQSLLGRALGERDAAIDLARKFRDAEFDTRKLHVCLVEFDRLYRSPPPTCEHEWTHTAGDPGGITTLCTICGETKSRRCEPLPTCKPLPPADLEFRIAALEAKFLELQRRGE